MRISDWSSDVCSSDLLKFDRRLHRTDLWVSWRNMIYKPSGEQEEILGGVNTRLHLLKKEGHSLSLPIQMLGWHRGGQIDTTSLETITQVNLAAGIEYAWERAGAVESDRKGGVEGTNVSVRVQ